MKNYFKKVKAYPYPDSALFQTEIDVITDLAGEVCRQAMPGITKGCCIIDGQTYGKEAKCIMRLTLPAGTGRGRLKPGKVESCSKIAEDTIDAALEYLTPSADTQTPDIAGSPVEDTHQADKNLFFSCDSTRSVLLLNANYGRFIIAACLKDTDKTGLAERFREDALKVTVARIISYLHPEDATLQQSVRLLMDKSDLLALRCMNYVTINFAPYPETEAIRKWRHYRSVANAGSRLFLPSSANLVEIY